MRFNKPTDYSPGRGNALLLMCQLSYCHPPSQHMGCVRSKKAAEQHITVFLLPHTAQLSHRRYWQLLELPISNAETTRSGMSAVRDWHSLYPLGWASAPDFNCPHWFKRIFFAVRNQKQNEKKQVYATSWWSAQPNHDRSDTFRLPISFFSFSSSAVATWFNSFSHPSLFLLLSLKHNPWTFCVFGGFLSYTDRLFLWN